MSLAQTLDIITVEIHPNHYANYSVLFSLIPNASRALALNLNVK